MEKYTEKKLLTVKDVAELLQVSPSSVYSLIHANVLPALKLKSFKVRPEAVDKFLADYEGNSLKKPSTLETEQMVSLIRSALGDLLLN